jgi:hypothetical protein
MIRILDAPITRSQLQKIADDLFGDLVKGVIDVQRGMLAVGGELHADEEAILLQDGSKQHDLWGINLYPSIEGNDMIEYDSMINIRPAQGNHSRTVEDAATRTKILHLINYLITG